MTRCGHTARNRKASQLIIGDVSAHFDGQTPRQARARLGRFAAHVARACVCPRLVAVTQ